MRTPTRATTKLFPLVGKCLLQPNACGLCRLHHLIASNPEQSRIRRKRNRLFLNGRINNHALKFLGLDRRRHHRGVDRRLQNLFDTPLANRASKAANLGRITGQSRFKILLPTEELKVHVLRPPLDHRFITLFVRVLQIQKRDHQPNRQTGTTCSRHTSTDPLHRRTKQVRNFPCDSGSSLPFKRWSQRFLNLTPTADDAQGQQADASSRSFVRVQATYLDLGGIRSGEHTLVESRCLRDDDVHFNS